MADLVTRLRLDSSQHNQELDKSKQKVHQYKQEADNASKSIEGMGQQQSRSAKDLLKAMSEIEGTTRSTSNYKAQLTQITKQIQDLTINYRAMNQEMQDSDFGREVSSKIEELTKKASEYKDAIMDANQSVSALASDTANWDAAKQGIELVSSSLQSFVSVGVLGEKTTEKLVAVIAKLKAMETATNAVIKVGNALQKNSALMMGISRVQAAALARAKQLEATATGKATIAQKLFNAVAKANPYVLLATAVLTVVSALAIFARKSKDVETATKEQTKELSAAEKEFKNYQSSLASTTGDILSKYKLLQIQYSKLKDEHEKAQWIKKNADEFDNLGLKIRDVNDAERNFVTNADNVIESLKKRAKALANQQRLVDLYKEQMEAELAADEEYNSRKAVLSDEAIRINEQIARGESVDPAKARWAQNMVKHVEQYNAKLRESVYKTTDEIGSRIESTAKEIAGELDVSDIIGSSGGNRAIKTTIEAPAIPGSLKAAQQEVAKLQDELNNMKWDDPSIETKKKELSDAKAEVERIQKLLEGTKPIEMFESGSLAEASHFVSVFEKQLDELNPDTEEFAEVNELLQIWLEKQEEIKKKVQDTKKESKTIVEQYQEIASKAEELKLQLKIGAIDKTNFDKQIAELNKQLEDKGLTIKVGIDIDTDDINLTAFDKALEKAINFKDKLGGVMSSISSMYDSISGLGDRLGEETDEIKKFFMVWEAGMSVANAAATTLQALAPVINTITAASEAAAAAKAKEAAASAANTTANEAESHSVLKTAIAKMMEAIAGGAKAVSSLGPIGPILAIAAAASITAALIAAFSKAKAQKFSTGGIFKGNSSVGDKNYARLNDGEMVLNTQQQKKLFKMLNANGVLEKNNYPDLGKVEFVIEGDKLVGTFNNYNRKIGHSKR